MIKSNWGKCKTKAFMNTINVKLNYLIMSENLNVNVYSYDGRYEGYEYVENWLMAIPESEWLYLTMLSETPDRRPLTEDEICYLAEIALPMYCQELKIDELPYDEDFLHTTVGYFLTAIVIFKMKLNGFATTVGPVKLYDSYQIEKTEKLDEYLEAYPQ